MGIDTDALLAEIRIIYRQLKECSYPDSLLLRQSWNVYDKDNSYATEYRNRGNSVYRCCKDQQALDWYTLSIAWATDKSKELALAYANRSAALFRLSKYVPCLLDINRALKGDKYPKHLRKKLRDRKKICLMEIAKMGVEIVGNETDPIDWTATSERSIIPRDNFDNPLLPNASSKIELAYNDKWGRHMVAAKDIEPGEILSSEQFFTIFHHLPLQCTHCSYCLVRCAALIPCPTCSQMMYCSESCLTQASNAYHRIECRMWSFPANENFTVGCVGESMRMLFIGTEQGTKLRQLTASLSIRDIFEENVNPINKPYADDYLSILHLNRTFDQPPKASVLVAVKAVIWLQRVSFFENRPDRNSMSETEIFVTLALLNHLQSDSFFTICDITSPADGNLQSRLNEQKIGRGILSLHNLVNHSCNPNVSYVATRKREQMFFSARPIKQGEQIFVGYCPSFPLLTLAARKKSLSLFKFTCYCEACRNDWPLNIFMKHEKTKFLTTDAEILLEIATTFTQVMKSCTKDTDIQEIIRFRKLIHDYIRSPSWLTTLCEDMILNYMSLKYSNLCYVNEDIPLDEKNYDGVEEQMFMKLFQNFGI